MSDREPHVMMVSGDGRRTWECELDITVATLMEQGPEYGQGIKIVYSSALPPDPRDTDPAYLAFCADMEEECELAQAAKRATGKDWDFCIKCGCLAVRVRITPTRQYGGGFDTFTECQFCGDADVAT